MQWDICELAYPNEYNGVYLYIYIYLNILNYDIRNKPYTWDTSPTTGGKVDRGIPKCFPLGPLERR